MGRKSFYAFTKMFGALLLCVLLDACIQSGELKESNLNQNHHEEQDMLEERKDDNLIIVDINGNGDYTTVQQAVNSAGTRRGEPTTIFIKNGVYKEKLYILSFISNLRLIGESREGTILTFDDNSQKPGQLSEQLGTRNSASTFVYSDNFYAENLTFENTEPVAQAVALYVSGDRAIFNNVIIKGYQDTLYSNEDSRQFYIDSHIEGTTDFIFGSATAVFENCIIHSKRNSYITAASTPDYKEYGFVFLNSELTADPEIDAVYLGRPWRPYSSVAFIHSEMGEHIKQEGWHNWGNPDNEQTARYVEYGNTGAGANTDERVHWSKVISSDEADQITIQSVLGGEDGWDPLEEIEKIKSSLPEFEF